MVNCKNCKKETNNKVFCSRSCAITINNIGLDRHKRDKKECPNCKNLLSGGSQNKYCNEICFREYQFQLEINKFEAGEVQRNSTLRKHLIRINGEFCNKCGCGNEWEKEPLTLEVDHIDGNSDNNLPSNLRLLCPNCHSQTPTSKGRNIERKDTKRNSYLRKYKGYNN